MNEEPAPKYPKHMFFDIISAKIHLQAYIHPWQEKWEKPMSLRMTLVSYSWKIIWAKPEGESMDVNEHSEGTATHVSFHPHNSLMG